MFCGRNNKEKAKRPIFNIQLLYIQLKKGVNMDKKKQDQDLKADALKQYMEDFSIEYVDEREQFQLCHHCD